MTADLAHALSQATPVAGAAVPDSLAGAMEYAQPWLAFCQRLPPVPAGTAAAAQLLAELENLQLALLADAPVRLRQRAGWWGRLLGRDLVAEQQAQQLAAGLPAVVARADAQARLLAADISRQQALARTLQQADAVADAWLQQGQGFASGGALPAPVLQALQARLRHLQRMILINQQAGQHWLQLAASGQALLQHYASLRDVLLPAWRQQQTLRTADPALQARIVAQLTQMRLQVDAMADPAAAAPPAPPL